MASLQNTLRRLLPWLISVVLVVVSAVCFLYGHRSTQRKLLRTPVAAYLLPVDDGSRVKISWRPAKRLACPLTLHADEPATIPKGSRAVVLHATTGATETITGPAKIRLAQKLPEETDLLASPLTEVVAKSKTPELPPDVEVLFTSPVGLTRYLNPLITWTTQSDKTYDVAVLDPGDPYTPPRVAEKIRPPIPLSELKTPQNRVLSFDRNYEIIVRESSSEFVAGQARFLTARDASAENQLPTAPAELLAEACAAMIKKPYRTGDAWLALSRLPADWMKSELVVRLRLRVGAEILSPSETDKAKSDAAALLQPQ